MWAWRIWVALFLVFMALSGVAIGLASVKGDYLSGTLVIILSVTLVWGIENDAYSPNPR